MKRKELKKAIKEYSNKINFYELGLVRKWILWEEKELIKLKNAIPKVKCPYCDSNNVEFEYDEDEYSDYGCFYCECCDSDFEDEFGYEDAITELHAFDYWDSILIELCFENPDTTTYKWKEFCRKELKRMIKED